MTRSIYSWKGFFHPKTILGEASRKAFAKLSETSRVAAITTTLRNLEKRTSKPNKPELANQKMKLGILPYQKLKDEHPKHCHLHPGGPKEHGVCFYVRQGHG